MFKRSFQDAVLRSEGQNLKPDEGHKMTWWYSYIDPSNSTKQRPVVDVSSPYNPLDETHQVRKLGVQKLALGFVSLNAFTGVREEVPYTDSMHTSECVKWALSGLNVWYMNWFLARAANSFSPVGNPRTKFAWNIAMAMGVIRVNIAGLIGIGGYFYAYEWLYTYGPWPFRIRDPCLNAWKRAWDEGQSCYAARAAASIFPALGYAFFMGRWKKTNFWFLCCLAAGLQYEYARQCILPGNRLFYSTQANKEINRQANWGSLMPVLAHRVDPDTNRNASVAQSRYIRIASGTLQDTIWANATHENIPFWRCSMRLPNPYFNWKKAKPGSEGKSLKYKNDLWELPQVLDAQTRSSQNDLKS
ncbi:hypothetical protein ERJ75_001433300 [Trypanosoma vivax]|uniref:Uncharacterized protein n=1 Tax=Trypanosoma vivax (strain Y486) TaxID=1055687 RepID=G0TTK3_TRYVY|nr:hypothetical protein TRVL_03575 [Trypanosoma vivax]KAH8606848.1 hypothetical protein ERJ75_001433300 [Trypanosoma vivax]CCC47284.1 conserved hypothetical protein [Trypanosoma vivax Y486]